VKPSSGWSGTLTETAELNASDEATGDWFGASVAISGDTIVVGAPFKGLGSAYVYVKPSNGWAGTLTESAKLGASASGGSGEEDFQIVAVDGDTVVVGVPLEEIGGNDAQGSAYVFAKPSGGWAGTLVESAKLTASDGAFLDQFGTGIGVHGDTVVAGAFGHAGFKIVVGPGGPEVVPIPTAGAVYVFVKPLAGWAGGLTETAKLRASDGDHLDGLGASVAVNGDDVYAGAPSFLSGKEGAAYVFVRPSNGWAGTIFESAKLTASDAAADDHLGSPVEVAGDTVLVGVRGQGAAYLFTKPQGGWSGGLTETEKVTVVGCCTLAFGGKRIVSGDEFGEAAYVFERQWIILLANLADLLKKFFNAGSTIPTKFVLQEADGTPITPEEARRLASSCSVRVFFSGGDSSSGCAFWNGSQFQFDLKTSRSLAPGSYTINVRAFVGREEAGATSTEVRIR
jgi:hypothetical protein